MSITRARQSFEAALGVAWLAFLLHAFVPFHGWVEAFFNNGVYYGLIIAAAAGCLLRAAVTPNNRWAWGSIAAGLVAWTVGDLYYLFRLQNLAVTPVPSLADVFYLLYFPLVYVGVVSLMRRQLVGATKALWLDGMTAALTVAAVACSLLLGPIQSATKGSLDAVATNLAYPLGDVVLLALLTALAVAQGFRLSRAALILVAGLVSATAADSLYLVQNANGTYAVGGVTDALWAASLLLIGAAAWRDESSARPRSAWRPIAALPLVCAIVATGLLSASNWRSLGSLGPALAAAAILTVLARLAVTLRENKILLATANDAAVNDALTGLANRRALMRDLEHLVTTATVEHPLALVLFDLNGFKSYNDRFGHPAGDSLLQRLGHRLQSIESDDVRIYRLGGDEFCIVARAAPATAAALIERAVAALTETAEGFSVTASFGAAFIPEEAETISEALRLADTRLYSRKADHYAAHDHPHEELLRILDSRDSAASSTRHAAANTARVVSEALGLDRSAQEQAARAALLRDVGTLALPDDLNTPTRPLTPAEIALVQQHPRIGERILASIPALREIAPIVGASHEHWDGGGYPCHLVGSAIPLNARIVAASTAFAEALAKPGEANVDAFTEVARQAGKKLDPDLVSLLETTAREELTRAHVTEPPE